MYIIMNAIKSITRAKGRNILIFILVLIIAVSSCIALSIKNSAEAAKEETYNSLNITAQISLDRQKLMSGSNFDKSEMRNFMSESLTAEELETYATSQYVENFYYTQRVGMNVLEDFVLYENSDSNMQMGFDKRGGVSSDISVTGYSSHDAMTSFISGENTICEGTVFEQDSDDNSCVISNELAVLNELSVGDEVVLSNPKDEEQTYTFTITGIFENATTDEYANQIFTSSHSIEKIVEDSNENAVEVENEDGTTSSTALTSTISGTYVFADVENYEAFDKDVEQMGLDTEKYTVSSSDLNQFEQSMVPLESLSHFTFIFLVVVLVIGGCILVIFNIFSIRERKYEIGVLAAIGMKKGKVALQFLIETFIITLLAIIVGCGIGIASAKPVGNMMLQKQVAATEQSAETTNQNFGGNYQGGRQNGNFNKGAFMTGGTQEIEYVDTIDTTTDFSVMISLMGIALLLTLVASSVGIISILRYDPLKILSERS